MLRILLYINTQPKMAEVFEGSFQKLLEILSYCEVKIHFILSFMKLKSVTQTQF